MRQEHEPAEVFPLAEFLSDEIVARGWTTMDVAVRMGGSEDEIMKNLLSVDLLMCVHKDGLLVGDQLFVGLSRVFDVDESYLRTLDGIWRRWPHRRSKFRPPESIFSAVSRNSWRSPEPPEAA